MKYKYTDGDEDILLGFGLSLFMAFIFFICYLINPNIFN